MLAALWYARAPSRSPLWTTFPNRIDTHRGCGRDRMRALSESADHLPQMLGLQVLPRGAVIHFPRDETRPPTNYASNARLSPRCGHPVAVFDRFAQRRLVTGTGPFGGG
jgi:hypothetical protein